jgi:hypothetical protein
MPGECCLPTSSQTLWGDEVPRSWSNILQGCVFDCEFGFSADGTLLTIRGGDGAVRLIDMDKRIQLGDALELGDQAASVALRPDGRELAFPSP